MFQKLSLETKYICSTMFVVLFVVVINLALYMHGYDAYSNSLTQQITNNSQEKQNLTLSKKGWFMQSYYQNSFLIHSIQTISVKRMSKLRQH